MLLFFHVITNIWIQFHQNNHLYTHFDVFLNGLFFGSKTRFLRPVSFPNFFLPQPTMSSASRVVTHDIPVDVIPRRLWNDFKEPSMPDFDVRDFLHSFLKPSGSHILFSGDRSGLDSADVLKLTTENRLQLILCAKLINSTLNRFIIDGLSTIN